MYTHTHTHKHKHTHTRTHTHTYIYISSCRAASTDIPDPLSPHSSPLAGLQSYIPYPHIAAVCMFELVVLLLIGHIGVHHL